MSGRSGSSPRAARFLRSAPAQSARITSFTLAPSVSFTRRTDASGSVVPQYFHLVKFLILTALIVVGLTVLCQFFLVESYCRDRSSLVFLGWQVYTLVCPPADSKITLSPIVTPIVILVVYLLYLIHHGNALRFIDSIEDKAIQVEDYAVMLFNMRDAQIKEDYIQTYLDNILVSNGYKERVQIAKISKASADCRSVLLEKEEQQLTKTLEHIQQYLKRGLIDEMHIAISPVLLGAGERLFEGVNLPALGYACTQHAATARATHLVFRRG